MRIFISYGRDEQVSLARRLKDDLLGRGHEVWFDEEQIKEGGDWERYIEEGLNFCAALAGEGRVVLLMTPHSVRRPDGYCLNEIAAAINRKMPIIPVMVVWCEPPLSICRIQWLDMQDCVPVFERQERYELKRQRLLEALEQGKLDFEATQADLLCNLMPLDFAADLAEHVPKFVGRQWLFRRIDDWLADPQASRIFWITGYPGVGKTALAAYLCHQRRDVVAFHLCRHGHSDKADPRRCVMSIAYQISSQLFEYQQRLVSSLYDLPSKSAATLFDNLIVQPLARQSQAPEHPLLIVIDGLDEATRNGRNELAEFLAREFPRTPPWLRLIVTSRPDPEVKDPLQKLTPLYLEADLLEHLQDLRSYLCQRLTLLAGDRGPVGEEVINNILEKSGGIFLYVDLVLADLKEGRLSLTRLEDFPRGLGEVFHQFFRRQFPDRAIFRQRHRPLLEMIIAARGPLPLPLAQAALQWGPYDYQPTESGEARGEALAPLGSLFPQASGHLRPFHASLITWLTNPVQAGDYTVDVRQGQARLAEVCWGEFKAGLGKMSPYTLAHLPGHLMETERWEDLLALLTSPGLGLIDRWLETGEGEQGLACLSGLIRYLARQNREPELAAGLATQAARIHSLWGEYDQAQAWLETALKKTSWLRGRRVAAIALHELGSLTLYRGDFHQAGRYYRQAWRRCRWGWPIYHDEAAANLVGLATVAHVRYNFADTRRYASQALKEARRSGDLRHLIAAMRLMAAACKSLGKYEEAETHLQVAALLAENFRAPLERARVLLLQGWQQYDLASLQRRAPAAARPCFREALKLAQGVRDFYCLTEAKLSLGWCALAELAAPEAAGLFAPLEDSLPRDRHPELQAMFKLGLAGVAHLQGELEASRQLYLDGNSFCRAKGVRIWHWRALIGLGAICWHTGRQEEGERFWEEALQVAGKISEAKIALARNSIELCREAPTVPPR
jgi:tetratricopeptide (TPR) repeat protein